MQLRKVRKVDECLGALLSTISAPLMCCSFDKKCIVTTRLSASPSVGIQKKIKWSSLLDEVVKDIVNSNL